VIKTSAMTHEHQVVESAGVGVHDQEEVIAAFKAGKLARDFVAVVRFPGPRAMGPERTTDPIVGSCKAKGFTWLWVTTADVGACRQRAAAIHVTPECLTAVLGGKCGTAM